MPQGGIVPWVSGADPARYFGPMFGEAASAASNKSQRRAQQQMEMIRMFMQQSQHAAEMAARQEEAAQQMELKKQMEYREQLQQQQKMAIDQQYKQQMATINQQKMEEARRKNDQAASATASQSAAMMQFQQRVRAGEDPNKLMMELGPAMKGGINQVVPASKAYQASLPKNMDATPIPGAPGMANIGGKPYRLPVPPTPKPTEQDKRMTEYRKNEAMRIRADLSQMSKDLALLQANRKTKDVEAKKKEIEEKNKELKELFMGTPEADSGEKKVIKIPMKDGQPVLPPELQPKAADKKPEAPAGPGVMDKIKSLFSGPSPTAPAGGIQGQTQAMIPPGIAQPVAPPPQPPAPGGGLQPTAQQMIQPHFKSDDMQSVLQQRAQQEQDAGQKIGGALKHLAFAALDPTAANAERQGIQDPKAAGPMATLPAMYGAPTQPPPSEMPPIIPPANDPSQRLPMMTPDDLVNMYRKGQMTRDEAQQALMQAFPDSGIDLPPEGEQQYSDQ